VKKTTTDPTARFFEELGALGEQPLLRKAKGSTRFDLVDGKRTLHWLVSVDRGKIAVSQKNTSADCVIRTQKAVFDKAASGSLNAVAAVLRGDIGVEGDWRLLVRMQRLFPSSPRSLRSAARRKRS
jgi:putative sterol carrier protein